jgi:hypothetical protein
MMHMIKTASRRSGVARVALIAAVAAPIVLIGAQAAEASYVLQDTPAPPGFAGPHFTGVSCPTTTACQAVGNSSPPSTKGFAEGWDGTSWTVESTPDPSSYVLNAVSCTSPTACTAVGGIKANGGLGDVAERWDGASWTIQTLPPSAGVLDGVSCTSATKCIAVGTAGTSGVPFSISWNGTTWTVRNVDVPPGTHAGFDSVSCTSGSACIAVGGYESSSGTFPLLAESWNGHRWTLQTAPPYPSGAENGTFSGVSCSSVSTCIAVGDYLTSSTRVALAEIWNGTSWTPQTTAPLGSSSVNDFYSVSCTHSGACVAGGDGDFSKTGQEKALAEHWNGTSWTEQTTVRPPGSPNSAFAGVSCATKSVCTSVGYYQKKHSGTPVLLAEQR